MSPTAGGGLPLFLGASAVVIALAYAASRFVGQWQVQQTRGRKLRVVEGVPLGRDRSLLLVAVGKELLVVGSSATGFAMLHQVTDPDMLAEALAVPAPPNPPSGMGTPALEAAVRANLERMRSLLARIGGGTDA